MPTGILDHFYARSPRPLLGHVNDDSWDGSSIPAGISSALALEFKVSRLGCRDECFRCRCCGAPVMLPGILDHLNACLPKLQPHTDKADNWEWLSIPASITGASHGRCASYARWDTRPFACRLNADSWEWSSIPGRITGASRGQERKC